jgi:hypothetical protein
MGRQKTDGKHMIPDMAPPPRVAGRRKPSC